MHLPTNTEEQRYEDVWYDEEHIQKILNEIGINFPKYFEEYIETEDGDSPNELDISVLANKFKISEKVKNKKGDKSANLKKIIFEEIESFEKDREKYIDLLDLEFLTESEDDPNNFKDNELRYQCPIIHKALINKSAKDLNQYRKDFNDAEASELLEVTKNIVEFANDYKKKSIDFNKVDGVDDLELEELLYDEYMLSGVIGSGIKTHLLYKLFPNLFSYRSRESIWALWFLTSKKKFNSKMDSEFLMINLEKSTTQQNYFYPYDLFGFYATKIIDLLKIEYKKYDVIFKDEYRFVLLDSFMSFVAKKNKQAILILTNKESDYGHF